MCCRIIPNDWVSTCFRILVFGKLNAVSEGQVQKVEMATLFFFRLRIYYFKILTWRSFIRLREVNVRGLLNEWGTANIPNFEVEYAVYLLFLTSQITTDISFDIIKNDQHNSCLYFCVLSLFVLDACDFTSEKFDLLYLSHTRDPSLLSSQWYFSRSRIFLEVLLKIQNKKGRKKERKRKKERH